MQRWPLLLESASPALLCESASPAWRRARLTRTVVTALHIFRTGPPRAGPLPRLPRQHALRFLLGCARAPYTHRRGGIEREGEQVGGTE